MTQEDSAQLAGTGGTAVFLSAAPAPTSGLVRRDKESSLWMS